MTDKDTGSYRIRGSGFSAAVDGSGSIRALAFGERVVQFAERTLYEINGEIAECEEAPASKAAQDLKAQPLEEAPIFSLRTKQTEATMVIASGPEIRFHVEPSVKSAGIVLSFPVEAEFHLPEYMNLGRKIDRDMPVGQWYSTSRYAEQFSYMRGLSYNFFLARVRGAWIRFLARFDDGVEAVRRCDFHVRRHPDSFCVTFTWRTPADAYVAVFSSMEEARSIGFDSLDNSLLINSKAYS